MHPQQGPIPDMGNGQSMSHKTIISVHIPKTAGTSLLAEIKHGAVGKYLLDYHDRPATTGWRDRLRRGVNYLKARRDGSMLLRNYDIIHGHFHVGKYAFLYPDADFITFMRDPVERVISCFYYFKYVASRNPATVKRNPNITLVANNQLDLIEFARLDMMKDIYSRYIGGWPLEKFKFIGITEQFRESIMILNKIFGINLAERHERPGNNEKYENEYRPYLRELRAANHENMRIYEAVVHLFNKKMITLSNTTGDNPERRVIST